MVQYMIFLQIHPEKNTLNCAFPFPIPKNVRIGLLKECLVIEYCGPEEVDSDILSIQGQDHPQYGIEDFLGLDLSHEIINKFAIGEPIENMTFFLGDSIAHKPASLHTRHSRDAAVRMSSFLRYSAGMSWNHWNLSRDRKNLCCMDRLV